MSGLFTIRQTQSQSRPDGRALSCVACGRSRESEYDRITPQGGFGKRILIINSAPSTAEAARNRLWTGADGRLLIDTFRKYGIRVEHDCVSYTAVAHATSDTPTGLQIDCCRKNILKVIEEYKPLIIVLLGKEAVQSVIGFCWKNKLDSFDLWRGAAIPDEHFKAWLMPIWEPHYVKEREKYGEIATIWEQDISNIAEHLKTPVQAEKQPRIEYLPADGLTELYSIKKPCKVVIDFETTGLKPHATGHRIICASVAVSGEKCYVFPISDIRKDLRPFIDILTDPQIEKIAHNMKYETAWALVRLRTKITPWVWDTMQAAHIIDNRPGICGLKLQTYLNLGIADYTSEVDGYLSAKDSNSLNNIQALVSSTDGMKSLMKYCGLDTIYTYRLAEKQMQIICCDPNLSRAYNLIHAGIETLSEVEQNGIRVDVEAMAVTKKELSDKITGLESEFYASTFYRHWSHVTNGNPNIASNPQLANFLYKVKKLEPKKFTENGIPATDEEALEALDIPELKQLLEIRKWKKVRDTYLESFDREQYNGIIRPFFNLHTVKTYRSSSDSPNFQNIPKRDKEATNLIRRNLFARPGHLLMEVDFSAIEVSIAACYHKDPVMLDYLIHFKDMHGDMAAQIFEIDRFDKHNKYHSLLRKAAKNSFVFPQFYGDYYKNNAIGLLQWCKLPTSGRFKPGTGVQLSEDGITIADHLISRKIRDFDTFVEHIRRIEDDFWNRRFRVYAKWKTNWIKHYRQNGYIDLHTGFRCSGVMSKNDVTNYPVQGAAFHCLLWSFIEANRRMKEQQYESRLIGQIHDAIVLDVLPEELDDVLALLQQITEVDLADHWPWIIVPMRIEAEISSVGGSWAEMEEITLKH
jgi:DNA polymerase I